MDYAILKAVHVGSAALSISGFAGRGVLMLRGSPMLQAKAVRILPHVVDTVLLASALGLVWMSGQYPGAQGWLTAKLVALVVYIALGTIALKRGRTRAVRALAFVLAAATAAYIVSVAVTRSPWGVLAG